jgi:uncharacterized protein (TIGR02145 family)
MKKSALKIFVILLAAMTVFNSCQKEDELIENIETDLAIPKLKSATSSDYLYSIIGIVEELIIQEEINKGIGNSLISKVKNAIKSEELGNLQALEGQLNSFINQVQGLINEGVISVDDGETLINKVEGGLILAKGIFIDPRDGNEYKIVLIGEQIWMAENLAYLPKVSPVWEESFTEPFYYVYGYDGEDVNEAKAQNTYIETGARYNYPAALIASPVGWHLPSDEDWIQLAEYINDATGGNENLDKYIWDNLAPYLKSTSWGGTDNFGFNAYPSGGRYYDGFWGGYSFFVGYFSSTPYHASSGSAWGLYISADYLIRQPSPNDGGWCIRCIKD